MLSLKRGLWSQNVAEAFSSAEWVFKIKLSSTSIFHLPNDKSRPAHSSYSETKLQKYLSQDFKSTDYSFPKISNIYCKTRILLRCHQSRIFPNFVLVSVTFVRRGPNLERLAGRELQFETDMCWRHLSKLVLDRHLWTDISIQKDNCYFRCLKIAEQCLGMKFQLLKTRTHQADPFCDDCQQTATLVTDVLDTFITIMSYMLGALTLTD